VLAKIALLLFILRLGAWSHSNSKRDRAREFILNHYTWDQIASQLIEVYKEICKKK